MLVLLDLGMPEEEALLEIEPDTMPGVMPRLVLLVENPQFAGHGCYPMCHLPKKNLEREKNQNKDTISYPVQDHKPILQKLDNLHHS